MNVIAIIPARMGSSRFPGKPMEKIQGIPMVGHCYMRCLQCNDLLDTFVATCDQEIFDYIKSIGGNVIMTDKGHERASDRTAEAMIKIEKDLKKKVDIVVMVQGDEPMITPKMISDSIKPLRFDSKVNVVNLMSEIKSVEEFEDSNEVKVVVDKAGNAIYFSREPIPSRKKGNHEVLMLKQVCVIPFRRDYLIKFNSTPETDLEIFESIDMMRIIENGDKVRMVMSHESSYSVDTKTDLMKVNKLMESDSLINTYIK